MDSSESPQPTPEASLDGNATNIIISDIAQKINPKSKNNSDKINFSLSKSSDKVEISKGAQQKQRAEYQSDRVYHKKDVLETVKSVKALRLLPNKARNELIDELWRGINYRYHEDARKIADYIIQGAVVEDANFMFPYFWNISNALFPLRYPMNPETLIFGGMLTSICM